MCNKVYISHMYHINVLYSWTFVGADRDGGVVAKKNNTNNKNHDGQ